MTINDLGINPLSPLNREIDLLLTNLFISSDKSSGSHNSVVDLRFLGIANK